MQTIATMAKRLDMSAEEALDTLKKLRFGLNNLEAEISDEQCDMLMDVDEDPSSLDQMLANILQKEDKVRLKVEREQNAIEKKKIAAAKKAAIAERKKATAEKKAAAVEIEKVDAEIKKKSVEKEDSETPAPPTLPEPIVVEIEATTSPDLEILPDKPTKADLEPDQLLNVAPDTVVVEIIDEDEDEDKYPHHTSEAADDNEPGGALAKAERKQAEEEQRRKERPLSVPDPDVVASVIRKAEERTRKATRKPAPPAAARPERKPRPAPAGAISREALAKVIPLEPESGKSGHDGGRRAQNVRGAARKPAVTGKTARKRQKRTEKAKALDEIMRRDAGAAVRGVLAGTTTGAIPKRRKKKRDKDLVVEEVEQIGGEIEVDEALTVENFADAMGADINDVILALMDENVMVNKNQTIEIDLMRKIAEHFDFVVTAVIPEEEDIFADEPDNPEDLELRAPVVTVMGHVDHGKTSLLDVVRQANVADGEAGGITQHIAAYDVQMEHGRVVFLDTPGHEAFTKMRSRGAHITDVVVLVVAADDGVKPQTIEAIDHARAADVPIVVAINKCDKANAQPDRVRQELVQYELVSEEWGGKTIIKNISAHTKDGIDELMELLVLESQLLELKANPKKSGRGTVVESEVSKGLGPVAWVLVQDGTLRVGDPFLAGSTYGRVRTMTDARGKQLKECGPSTPVVVTGFNETADAGSTFAVVAEERIARNIAEKRALLKKQKRGPAAHKMTLEDFHASLEAGVQKNLNVIIKADVQGSADVLHSSLSKLGNEEVSVNIVHAGVGGVNESDVILANASNAVIIGFHVTANSKVKQIAADEGIEIRSYRIIYEAIDDVKNALEGMLTPDSKEIVIGHAETRAVFRSSALGNIAGSIQLDGQTDRNALARLIRDGVIIYEGKIATLRREKDNVKSVATGFECGIRLDKFDDIQTGDIIETYKIDLIAKKLD